MEWKIIVELDGTVREFPAPGNWTFREANLAKRLTGLRVGELQEAIEKFDPDSLLALAAIAIRRDNPLADVDQLRDLPVDKITLRPVEDEAKEKGKSDPPAGAGDEPADAKSDSPQES